MNRTDVLRIAIDYLQKMDSTYPITIQVVERKGTIGRLLDFLLIRQSSTLVFRKLNRVPTGEIVEHGDFYFLAYTMIDKKSNKEVASSLPLGEGSLGISKKNERVYETGNILSDEEQMIHFKESIADWEKLSPGATD